MSLILLILAVLIVLGANSKTEYLAAIAILLISIGISVAQKQGWM